MSSRDPASAALLDRARLVFHAKLLLSQTIAIIGGKVTIADSTSKLSSALGLGVTQRLIGELGDVNLPPQTRGRSFEEAEREYLAEVLPAIASLLPGKFSVECHRPISAFAQYAHLRILEQVAAGSRDVRLALGGDYVVKPDIVVSRCAMTDAEINVDSPVVSNQSGLRATLRSARVEILHASISCKLTIRSDRSQNSRLEALNLLRNRRGRAPHIVVVTAEPLPSRIASIAVGTGDFDCIYHAALPELLGAMDDVLASDPTRTNNEQYEKLTLMVDSGRLRDVADLPLDLVL